MDTLARVMWRPPPQRSARPRVGHDVSDEIPAPTILERMISAKMSEERARKHLADGSVRVDGGIVTDPDHRGGTRIVILGQ
jgi:hypothetical protein